MFQKEVKPSNLTIESKNLWIKLWEIEHLSFDRDFLAVKILCDSYDEYLLIRKAMRKRDFKRTHINSNGTLQTHPYVSQLREVQKFIWQAVKDLALTPVEAKKLNIFDSEELDILKAIMKDDR